MEVLKFKIIQKAKIIQQTNSHQMTLSIFWRFFTCVPLSLDILNPT